MIMWSWELPGEWETRQTASMLQMIKMEQGKLSVHLLDPATEKLPQSCKEGGKTKKPL